MVNDYIVVSTNQKNVYEVHKFNGNDTPEVTYTIVIDHNNKWRCNCPSGKYRGYCKHHKMVKEYRRLERQGKTLGNIISFEEQT